MRRQNFVDQNTLCLFGQNTYLGNRMSMKEKNVYMKLEDLTKHTN